MQSGEADSASRAGLPPGLGPTIAEVDLDHHLLRGVQLLESPHCDDRPDPNDISLLVIHAISLPPGEFGGPWIERLFLGTLEAGAHPSFESLADVRVSAHLCIRRNGEIQQFVPFHRRAWHAGESRYEGRTRCNDFSIGVELEGSEVQAFEPGQYRQLIAIARGLMAAYPGITPERMVGHSDIAPERKTDPGPYFDWTGFLFGLDYAR